MKGGARLWCETWHHITIHHKRTIGYDTGWCETWHHITIHHTRIRGYDAGWWRRLWWPREIVTKGSGEKGNWWRWEVVTKGSGDEGKWWLREVVTKGSGEEGKWWPREMVTKGSGEEGKWWPREMVTKGSGEEGKWGDEGKWWGREVVTLGSGDFVMAAWMLHGACVGEEAGARNLAFFRVSGCSRRWSCVRRLRLGSFLSRVCSSSAFCNEWLCRCA